MATSNPNLVLVRRAFWAGWYRCHDHLQPPCGPGFAGYDTIEQAWTAFRKEQGLGVKLPERRVDPPTEKQVDLLERWGFDIPDSKQRATVVISEEIARRESARFDWSDEHGDDWPDNYYDGYGAGGDYDPGGDYD